MKTLLKNAREQKNIKTRELAQLIGIDQALISKFENGSRKPTRDQVAKLAQVLEIDYENLMVLWLKERILYEIGEDNLALRAMNMVSEAIENSYISRKSIISTNLKTILDEIDALIAALNKFDSASSITSL